MVQRGQRWATTAGAGVLLLLLLLQPALGLDNGLGSTPPMGFNTWNYFGCDINESVIRSAADKLVALGLAARGYSYVNIDDCWHARSRNASGQLSADAFKFPSGMAALAADIHAAGLKLGIYSDAGLLTCAGFPGSRYHEADDAALFASWGVDYLKYDNCFAGQADVVQRYEAMRDALNATGRPIFFSMCEWGVANPWRWAPAVANSWRTDADISAGWDAILRALDDGAAGLARFAGRGKGWNDPDMLEVGNGDLSPAQQRSHFALWALVKAPLLIGANLDALSATSLQVLAAEEVIGINQDALGVPGDIIWKQGPSEVWAAPLAGGERAAVLFNRHWVGPASRISVSWEQLGLAAGQAAAVRDLFGQRDLGVFTGSFAADVGNMDVVVVRVKPLPSGQSGEEQPLDGWRGRLLARLARLACAVTQRLLGAVRACGGDEGHAGAATRQREMQAEWRPWSHLDAAQLQAALRRAARARRQQRAAEWRRSSDRRRAVAAAAARQHAPQSEEV